MNGSLSIARAWSGVIEAFRAGVNCEASAASNCSMNGSGRVRNTNR